MQTTDCRVAVEHLLAYWENPDLHRAEAQAALSHIGKCPHCERRMGYLVRALAADEEDLMTCQECQDLLPEYLQVEAEGRADDAQWHLVAFHLETCPHCSAEYAQLSKLLELAHGERGEEPPRYPVPDLSFLRRKQERPPQSDNIFWRLDELGHMIVGLSADVLRAFQMPTYQPAYAMVRSRSESPRVLCQISLKEAVKDTEITITAEEERADPTRCTVTVKVNIPSRGGWPNLAGTEVVLKRGELELDTQTTDAHGEVAFEGVATEDLAHLVFEIVPHR
jgi:hypothetical protein